MHMFLNWRLHFVRCAIADMRAKFSNVLVEDSRRDRSVQSSRAACSLTRVVQEAHRHGDLVVRGRQLRLHVELADVAQHADRHGEDDGAAEGVASEVAHHGVAGLLEAAVDQHHGEALQPERLVAEQHAVALEEP
eukprot:4563683-Heterocapsa_arctica.AAC.1